VENFSLVPFGRRSWGIPPRIREKVLIFSQIIDYKDFIAADAVQCEPLSRVQIPDNREKYREFFE
jgi:hypothetical protein